MGIEIHNEAVNKMINETANNIRNISAQLMPLMTITGHPMEICQFNDYANQIATALEDEVVSNNKKPSFSAPLAVSYSSNMFLLNLGMCLCRSYYDLCENCPNIQDCEKRIIKDNPTTSNKVVPLTTNKDNKFKVEQNKSILMSENDFIQTIQAYAVLFPEGFKSDSMKDCLAVTITKIKKVYKKDIYDIEKIAELLSLAASLLKSAVIEFKKNQETEEFL